MSVYIARTVNVYDLLHINIPYLKNRFMSTYHAFITRRKQTYIMFFAS